MLDEVSDQHVSPRSGDAGAANGSRVELIGQPFVQPPYLGERVEHLRIARRVRGPSRDHVASVLAMLAAGTEELASPRHRVADCVAQLAGGTSVQLVAGPVDPNGDGVAVGRDANVAAGELDQERGNSVSCVRTVESPR